jgi:hypothetical protein
MCRDLTHKVDTVKLDRAVTDRFRTEESPPATCPAAPAAKREAEEDWGNRRGARGEEADIEDTR